MRWRIHRQKRSQVQDAPLASPSDAIVSAIDAAMTFTSTRELLSGAQVASLFDMLLCAAGPHEETRATRDAIEGATGLWAHRRLVSTAELRDRLLDLRLTARPPHDDDVSVQAAGAHPLAPV